MQEEANSNVAIVDDKANQQQVPAHSIKLDLEKIRAAKLFISTPMYGGMCTGRFMNCCLELASVCHNYGVQAKFNNLTNESLIPRARNMLVDEFLRSDYTHFLFLDADISFDPIDIIALISLDKEIIGAPYPKKTINWKAIWEGAKNLLKHPNFDESKFDPNELEGLVGEYVFNPIPGTKQFNVFTPLEVMELGTGYMMVQREVFVKFKESYPHLVYRPDHKGQQNFDGSRMSFAYFDTVIDPDSLRYLSEDYMFSQYWRAVGGSVWMCPWMKTKHLGTYEFSGDMVKVSHILGKM